MQYLLRKLLRNLFFYKMKPISKLNMVKNYFRVLEVISSLNIILSTENRAVKNTKYLIYK